MVPLVTPPVAWPAVTFPSPCRGAPRRIAPLPTALWTCPRCQPPARTTGAVERYVTTVVEPTCAKAGVGLCKVRCGLRASSVGLLCTNMGRVAPAVCWRRHAGRGQLRDVAGRRQQARLAVGALFLEQRRGRRTWCHRELGTTNTCHLRRRLPRPTSALGPARARRARARTSKAPSGAQREAWSGGCVAAPGWPPGATLRATRRHPPPALLHLPLAHPHRHPHPRWCRPRAGGGRAVC